MRVAGIGGANMDICAAAAAPLRMEDSNPGSILLSPGGVCRNILENLARLTVPVSLCTVVGDDAFGDALLAGCRALSIDTTGVLRRPGRTPVYLSVLGDGGDMLVAVDEMDMIKAAGAELPAAGMDIINAADLCVCDANLSPAAMAYLLDNAKVPVWCDPVSVTWARSVRPFIGGFWAIKPNLLEAQELTGIAVTDEASLARAAEALLKAGLHEVYITLGAGGICYADRDGAYIRTKARAVPPIANATGAGDAALAGAVYAALLGRGPRGRVEAALGASLLAIAAPETVSPALSPAALEQCIKEYVV